MRKKKADRIATGVVFALALAIVFALKKLELATSSQ
jgi:hypothetical protein